MILKLLISSLLALSAANSFSANANFYRDKSGQIIITNVSNNNSSVTYTKKVKITQPSDSNETKKHREKLMADIVEELRLAEEETRVLIEDIEKHNLKILTESRRKGTLTPDESQIILESDMNGIVDVGAKIGMTHNQVLKNTYWGKADRTYTITDEYGKLDYWSYESYGGLYFDNDKLIKIHANSITDRQ